MGILDKMVKVVAIKAAENVAVHSVDNITKYMETREITHIKVPASAEDYINRNYEEVKNELCAYGFNNIAFIQKKDLIIGWLTKDGAVKEISINGKSNFRKKAKFRSDSRIVIVYHTFR